MCVNRCDHGMGRATTYGIHFLAVFTGITTKVGIKFSLQYATDGNKVDNIC